MPYTVYKSNEDGSVGLYTGDWTDVPRLTTLKVFEDFDEGHTYLKDLLREPARRHARMLKAYYMTNRELHDQGKPYVDLLEFSKAYEE